MQGFQIFLLHALFFCKDAGLFEVADFHSSLLLRGEGGNLSLKFDDFQRCLAAAEPGDGSGGIEKLDCGAGQEGPGEVARC